jgi:SAM-dependent methyltransferase
MKEPGTNASPKLENIYNDGFFREIREGSERSAQVVVPMVMDLLGPKSVIDVGCGTGAWLAAFRDAGVAEIQGLEGARVAPELAHIDLSLIERTNLVNPFKFRRRFDLAMTLEVAEHLPPESASGFVESLTGLSSAILFSAAVPYQRGVGHLNEQWPEYWADLFRRYKYELVDCLRDHLWNDERVELWYRQNLFIFVREADFQQYPKLQEHRHGFSAGALARVHPKLFLIECQMSEKHQQDLAFWNQEAERCQKYIVELEEKHRIAAATVEKLKAFSDDLQAHLHDAIEGSEERHRYIQELQQKLDASVATIEELRSYTAGLQTRHDNAAANSEMHRGYILELEEKLKTSAAAIEELRAYTADLQTRHDNATANSEMHRGYILELEEKLKTLVGTIEEHHNYIRDLQREREFSTDTNEELRSHIADLQVRHELLLQGRTRENDDLRDRLSQAKAEIEQQSSEIEELARSMAQREAECKQLIQRVSTQEQWIGTVSNKALWRLLYKRRLPLP